MFRQFLTACAFTLVGAAFAAVEAADQPQTRTVFVNAVNGEAGLVSDLRANEVSITENNMVRRVVNFEPAADRVRLALVIDERALWSGPVRQSVDLFARALDGKADIALFSPVRPERKVIDFVPSAASFLEQLARTGSVSNDSAIDFDPAETLDQLARMFERQSVKRPVIVAIDQSPVDRLAPPPTWIVNELERGRTTVFAVGRGSVRPLLIASAHATGGTAEAVLTDVGLSAAVARVAQQILAQYALTYTTVDVPRDGFRLRVTVDRPGVTARALEHVYR
jgi:hypothetical protein